MKITSLVKKNVILVGIYLVVHIAIIVAFSMLMSKSLRMITDSAPAELRDSRSIQINVLRIKRDIQSLPQNQDAISDLDNDLPALAADLQALSNTLKDDSARKLSITLLSYSGQIKKLISDDPPAIDKAIDLADRVYKGLELIHRQLSINITSQYTEWYIVTRRAMSQFIFLVISLSLLYVVIQILVIYLHFK